MILTGSLFQNTLKLFGLVIIFILIIAACYYVTRFVGSKSMGAIRESNIKLVDTCRINQNQCLVIVSVGKRYYLLASNKDSVTMLSELSQEDLTVLQDGGAKKIKFQDVFASFSKKQEPKQLSEDSDDTTEL